MNIMILAARNAATADFDKLGNRLHGLAFLSPKDDLFCDPPAEAFLTVLVNGVSDLLLRGLSQEFFGRLSTSWVESQIKWPVAVETEPAIAIFELIA
jgi:hypothetical protein